MSSIKRKNNESKENENENEQNENMLRHKIKKPKSTLIEDEAEEDISSDEEDTKPIKPLKTKNKKMDRKKMNKKNRKENDEESNEENSDEFVDSSEEDDDDENNEYENDGFVVDDLEGSEDENEEKSSEDEEEISDNEEERRSIKKKKRKQKKRRRLKQKKDNDIDEEDIALLRENLGYGAGGHDDDDDDDDEIDDDDEESIDERTNQNDKKHKERRNQKDLGREIFGDSDDEESDVEKSHLKDKDKKGIKDKSSFDYADDMDYESDDLDDFIVEDEDGARRDKTLRTTQRHKRVSDDQRSVEGPSVYQIDEAEELFGDVEDLLEATHGVVSTNKAGDTIEGDESKPKELTKQQKLLKIYEPSLLKERMLTNEYETIRKMDIPERFLLDYGEKLLNRIPDTSERQEEAEWIARKLYDDIINYRNYKDDAKKNNIPPTISISLAYPRQMTMGNVTTAIVDILRFLQEEQMEIFYIKQYCKEFYKSAGLGTKHLYAIYEMDVTWRKLTRRKLMAIELVDYLRETASTSSTITDASKKDADNETNNAKDVNEKTKEDPRIDSKQFDFYYQMLTESPHASSDWVLKDEYLRDIIEFLKCMIPDSKLREMANFRPKRKDVIYKRYVKRGLRSLLHSFTSPAMTVGKRLYALLESTKRESNVNPDAIAGDISDLMLFDDDVDVPDPDKLPLDVASAYINNELKTTNEALLGMRYVGAYELSLEPNIRQYLRGVYADHVLITTTATDQGKALIDEFHYAHGLQYMVDVKPSDLLQDHRFIRLDKAEKEGLIITNWHVESDKLPEFYKPFERVYLRQKPNSSAEWEDERKSILRLAIEKMLFIQLQHEVRIMLLRENKEALVKECGDRLLQHLMVRPYDPLGNNEQYSTVASCWTTEGRYPQLYMVILDTFGNIIDKRKMSIPTTKLDEIRMNFRNGNPFEGFRDITQDFLNGYSDRIDLVVLNAGSGGNSLYLKFFLESICQDVFMSKSTKVPVYHVNDDFARIYAKSIRSEKEFPNDCEEIRSATALGRYIQNPVSEFSGLWGSTPYDLLYTTQNDILCLSLHPYQHFVARPLLLREYLRRFTYVVNHTGVDLNLAVQHPHHSYFLQFVSGLGPTKAAYLLEEIKKKYEKMTKRQDLQTIIGKVIYRNAGGFIRIRDHDLILHLQANSRGSGNISKKSNYYRGSGPGDDDINPLVDTRVHPEAYYMAVKMCGDANETTLDMYNPRQFALAIEDVMLNAMARIKEYYEQNPLPSNEYMIRYRNRLTNDTNLQDSLSELDITAYAQRLEQEGRGPKLSTLDFIKRELRYPYHDKRYVYRPPQDMDLFYLTIHETKKSLAPYMFIPIEIVNLKEGSEKIFVRLPSHPGVRAFLYKEHLPSYMTPEYLEMHGIQQNSTFYARILEFQVDTFLNGNYILRVGCDDNTIFDTRWVDTRGLLSRNLPRTLELMGKDATKRNEKHLNKNPIEISERQEHLVENARYITQSNKTFASYQRRMKRQIVHPAFRNFNLVKTIEYLRPRPIGECLLRPSTQGTMHLTLTWKMMPNIYRHYDIEEEKKIVNSSAYTDKDDTKLGERLIYKDEKYDSIDELIGRLVQPMNELVEEVLTHKYYREIKRDNAAPNPSGKEKETDEMYADIHKELYEAKKESPSAIPYRIHSSIKHQMFCISYLPRITVRHAYFDVYPNGFRFMSLMDSAIIPTLKYALLYFKKKALDLRVINAERARVMPPQQQQRRDWNGQSMYGGRQDGFNGPPMMGPDRSYMNQGRMGRPYDGQGRDMRYSDSGRNMPRGHPGFSRDNRRFNDMPRY